MTPAPSPAPLPESSIESLLESLLESTLELSLDSSPDPSRDSSVPASPDPEPEMLRGRKSAPGIGVWTASEHKRFRAAERKFPNGPWRRVAAAVGTRTTKQTISHAHKCRERRRRHALGLKTPGRKRRKDNRRTASGSRSSSCGPPSGSGSGTDSDGFATPELSDLLDEIADDETTWGEIVALNAWLAPFTDLLLVDPSGVTIA